MSDEEASEEYASGSARASDPDVSPNCDGAGYPIGSDRSAASSEGEQLGSSPAERDSAGYQSDSEGSQSSRENTGSGEKTRHGEDTGGGEDSGSDFVSALARAARLKERDERRRAPGVWLPTTEDFDRDPEPRDDTEFGVDGPVRAYSSRQLGLRLRPNQFERLLEAARLYGVRPTTMARMMVVRGINAIHDAELRARARELREES